jgi:hypothetical protein
MERGLPRIGQGQDTQERCETKYSPHETIRRIPKDDRDGDEEPKST